MRKLTSLAAVLLASVVLASCSSSKNEFEGIPAQELYDKGQSYLEKGDYNNALRYLQEIDARTQKGMSGEQVQLSLIYAQYKIGEYYKALDVAERFARVYPNSNSMDYVFYLAGLSNARLGDNWIQDTFRINGSERSVDNVRNAYGNFKTLVEKYPNSQYAAEAQEWLLYTKDRLAQHELKIAQFYMKRNAYVAAANRIEEMLKLHPEAKATYEALPLLQKAFESMGIDDSAQKVVAMIEAGKDKEFPTFKKPEYPSQF